MAYIDLVSDILQRIAAKQPTLPSDVMRSVEAEIRADFGGERHYIAKIGSSGHERQFGRNKSICDDFRRGVSKANLSIRYNLSLRRIDQIVAAHSDDSNEIPT